MQPTSRISISIAEKLTPDRKNFKSLMPLAPTMVGIAIKKLNSAAVPRDTPARMPPRMVEPERDVPGTRLRHWLTPIIIAVPQGRLFTS